MDFLRITGSAPLLASWLVLTALAVMPAAADPAEESTLTVALAASEKTRAEPLATSHKRDRKRIESQIRADVRDNLDANMATSMRALLAEPAVAGDDD